MAEPTLTDRTRTLLRELMDNEGLSARELGRRAGVPNSTIVRFLNHQRVPSLDTTEALFAGLGVELVIDVRPL